MALSKKKKKKKTILKKNIAKIKKLKKIAIYFLKELGQEYVDTDQQTKKNLQTTTKRRQQYTISKRF